MRRTRPPSLAFLGLLLAGAVLASACEPSRSVRASGGGSGSGGARRDGGAPGDGSPGVDADPAADIGPAGDAGLELDGGPPLDAGLGADAADTGGAPRDAGPGPTDGGAAGPDAGAFDSGLPALSYCRERCASVADCTQNSPIYDADNYACRAGICEWTGCRTDAECQAALSDPAWGCRPLAGASLSTCVKRCSAALDCTSGQDRPLDRAHNWSCRAGWCESEGCRDDAECLEAFGTADYACRVVAGSRLRACQRVCTSPVDCAQPSAAYDADNWRCAAGICSYEGCRADAECSASFMSPDYVCR